MRDAAHSAAMLLRCLTACSGGDAQLAGSVGLAGLNPTSFGRFSPVAFAALVHRAFAGRQAETPGK